MAYWLCSTDPQKFEVDMKNDFLLDGYGEETLHQAIRVEPGDRVVYYIQGWGAFGAICVIRSRAFLEWRVIWPGRAYPIRFERRPEVVLPRERMLKARDILPRLSFIPGRLKQTPAWGLAIREGLHPIPKEDFELLEREMKKLAGNG